MNDTSAAALRRTKRTAEAISATEPDWSRERQFPGQWEPSKRLLKSIRDYQRAKARRAGLASKFAVLRHRFWSVVTGADIPLNCRIGGGLLIPHPNGIVIHPDAEVGPNCLLFQQVTIGDVHGKVPRVGGHVDVGAGAKLIGGIVIGDHAVIGANSVVTSDVPAGATAVGVPARILKSPRSRSTAGR
jgi:serine O-acetyltransferase